MCLSSASCGHVNSLVFLSKACEGLFLFQAATSRVQAFQSPRDKQQAHEQGTAPETAQTQLGHSHEGSQARKLTAQLTTRAQLTPAGQSSVPGHSSGTGHKRHTAQTHSSHTQQTHTARTDTADRQKQNSAVGLALLPCQAFG